MAALRVTAVLWDFQSILRQKKPAVGGLRVINFAKNFRLGIRGRLTASPCKWPDQTILAGNETTDTAVQRRFLDEVGEKRAKLERGLASAALLPHFFNPKLKNICEVLEWDSRLR